MSVPYNLIYTTTLSEDQNKNSIRIKALSRTFWQDYFCIFVIFPMGNFFDELLHTFEFK